MCLTELICEYCSLPIALEESYYIEAHDAKVCDACYIEDLFGEIDDEYYWESSK